MRLVSLTARANTATGAASTRTRTDGPHSFHSMSAGGSFQAIVLEASLDDTLTCFHPGPQQRREPLTMHRRVAERELIELRPLQEEVQIVFPGETDAAVHLERRRHHPFRRVTTPDRRRLGRRCTTRPSRRSSACLPRRPACRRSDASPPGTIRSAARTGHGPSRTPPPCRARATRSRGDPRSYTCLL